MKSLNSLYAPKIVRITENHKSVHKNNLTMLEMFQKISKNRLYKHIYIYISIFLQQLEEPGKNLKVLCINFTTEFQTTQRISKQIFSISKHCQKSDAMIKKLHSYLQQIQIIRKKIQWNLKRIRRKSSSIGHLLQL